MKANEASEKIYLFENPISGTLDDRWLSKRSDDEDVEYVRKDAFIEKACGWLEDNASNYIIEHPFGSDVDFEEDKMIEDFKKYMRG